MFQIVIDDNTLIAIIAIILLLLVIAILIFIAIMYYIKKKFDSINNYSESNKDSYEDNIRKFDEIQYKMGIKHRKSPKMRDIIKEYLFNKKDGST